jgi:hypothetical protein
MSIAVEFLPGPGILMVRVYAQWRAAERLVAVKSVEAHGCYRPGIPVLVDGTHVARDGLSDVRALGAALASSLEGSRIAIVVSPRVSTATETYTTGAAVFTSREDALGWLTARETPEK